MRISLALRKGHHSLYCARRAAPSFGEHLMTQPVRYRESQVYALVLGMLIMRLRERQQLTQAQLAEQIGITQSTLSRIERGQVQPEPFVVRQLAAAFGMSTADFDQHVEDAYRRTERAAQDTVRKSEKQPWWQVALAVAGIAGLAGLVTFAVAAVLNELEEEERRRRR
jgi:transcriptional regulator with XRE-family HTH domain